jgi:ribosomal protein L11 methyltransferase
MTNWKVLRISGEDLEERISLLFEGVSDEIGFSGVEFNTDGSCTCYLVGEVSQILKEQIQKLNLHLENEQDLADQNWTQSCPELFEPIHFDKLSIIPVTGLIQSREYIKKAEDILIIPGTGFGTGHHATTRNLIRILQREDVAALKVKSVLDAGSGSGILALVCSKLFNCDVDAFELDPLACENAVENVQINGFEKNIKIFEESVSKAEGSYDLVVANLYAELLDSLCLHLVNRLKRKSMLLLSGIRSDLVPHIKEKYEAHSLQTLETAIVDGWGSMLMKLDLK